MKKTLPSLRIEDRTRELIDMALKKLNKNPLTDMSLQEFRRVACELLAQLILQDIPLPVKIK